MKFGLKIAGVIAVVLIAIYVVSKAFGLISMPSDVGVVVGIAELLVVLVCMVVAIQWIVKRIKGEDSMKTIKSILALVLLPIVLSVYSGCGRIAPGHAGIKVNNLGTERGVQNYTITTGFYTFVPLATSIFNYPTYVQTAIWTRDEEEGSPTNEEISFNTKEGTAIQADISLSYQLNADKVPSFYVKFRSDYLNLFTHGFLRNIARDAFNELAASYTLEEVYGLKKEELLASVRKRINTEVNQYGIELIQMGFTGALRMDPAIMAALNTKLTSIQAAIAAENQLRQSQAEAQKAIAKAEGEARSNELLAKSITPQLIQWRNLQITEQAVNKWNGARPLVEGSDSGLLLQLPLQR